MHKAKVCASLLIFVLAFSVLLPTNAFAEEETASTIYPLESDTVAIVTDLPANITFNSSPATIRVECTGSIYSYQWYFGDGDNSTPIEGANSDNITIRDSGYYYVEITGTDESVVRSATAYVYFDFVIPVINRKVTLPQVQGIITTPYAGTHYVRSRDDFVFEMWPEKGYSLSSVTVTTDRDNEVDVQPTFSSTEIEGLRVTVKHINAETVIRIDGVGPAETQAYEIFSGFSRVRNYNQPISASINADYILDANSGIGCAVRVNNVTLQFGAQCTLASGSVVVTLLPAYLKTLQNGSYLVEIRFPSGAVVVIPLMIDVSASGSAPPSGHLPATGDEAPLGLFLSLFVATSATLLVKRRFIRN